MPPKKAPVKATKTAAAAAPGKKVAFTAEPAAAAVKSSTVKAVAPAKAALAKKAAAPASSTKAAAVAAGVVIPAAAASPKKKAASPKKQAASSPKAPGAAKAAAKARDSKKGKAVKVGKKGTKADGKKKEPKRMAPYQVLRVNNLPEVFQEPELRKFLSQFGTRVVSVYVVRTGSNKSRGIGYVRFADTTTETAYAAILDECHGMLLGGKTVTARYVTLTKPMPNKRVADARRRLDWLNQTRGRKLVRYDATAKRATLDVLARAVKNEKATNAALAKLGIKYEFHGFESQVAAVKAAVGEAGSPPPAQKAKTAAATPKATTTTTTVVAAASPKSPKASPAAPAAKTVGKKAPAAKPAAKAAPKPAAKRAAAKK